MPSMGPTNHNSSRSNSNSSSHRNRCSRTTIQLLNRAAFTTQSTTRPRWHPKCHRTTSSTPCNYPSCPLNTLNRPSEPHHLPEEAKQLISQRNKKRQPSLHTIKIVRTHWFKRLSISFLDILKQQLIRRSFANSA